MPRDGSATRERILDVAERLVIENGYSATSLDRVIAEAGTSKGAFFHHFDSKLELAQCLVERYVAADLGQLERAVAVAESRSDDPVRQAVDILGVFEDEADELMSEQSSCLYLAVLTERQLADVGSADQINRAILGWRTTIADLLRRAYAQLDSPPPIDPEALADHVFVTFEGSFLLCRSTGDPGHMRRQLTALRQLVTHLLRAPG